MPPAIVLHIIVGLALIALQTLANFSFEQACLLVLVVFITNIAYACGKILEKLERTQKESK